MRLHRPLLAWLWTLLIFVLCWTPRQYVPGENDQRTPFLIPHFDKIVHFTLFAGFAFLWMRTGAIKARWVLVAGVVAAAVSELGQANSIVRRDANWPDGFADTLGVVAGLGSFYLARVRGSIFQEPPPPERPT